MYHVYDLSTGKWMHFPTKERLIFAITGMFKTGFSGWNNSDNFSMENFSLKVAMNPNDRVAFDDVKFLRPYMFFDADYRVIDVREWKEEILACQCDRKAWRDKMFHVKHFSPKFRAEPVPRTGKRPYYLACSQARGLKQELTKHELIDKEDILEYFHAVPDKFLRKTARDKWEEKWGEERRSWKDSSKARKNWQRHGQKGYIRNKRCAGRALDIDALNEELCQKAA